MKLLVTLQRSGGIEGLARQVGLSAESAALLCEAVLAPLMLAMRRFVRRAGGDVIGVQRLLDLVDEHGDGALAAAVLAHEPADPQAGELLLQAFFIDPGERADRIARIEGLTPADHDRADRLLPLFTMLVCGYLAAQAGGSGAQGSGGLANLGPTLEFLTSDDADDDCGRL